MNTSKTTKKVTTPKSFRVFDFYVDNKENRFYIQMFGINDKGETASITIDDYLPFFYFKVEEDWNEGQLREFQRKINQSLLGPYDSLDKSFIYRAELVQHKQLYGFNAGKKFKFAKLTFQNTTNFNKVKMQYYKKKGPFWNKKIEIYEANIPPLLRYFHICEISPSGWVQINQKKSRKVAIPSLSLIHISEPTRPY